MPGLAAVSFYGVLASSSPSLVTAQPNPIGISLLRALEHEFVVNVLVSQTDPLAEWTPLAAVQSWLSSQTALSNVTRIYSTENEVESLVDSRNLMRWPVALYLTADAENAAAAQQHGFQTILFGEPDRDHWVRTAPRFLTAAHPEGDAS